MTTDRLLGKVPPMPEPEGHGAKENQGRLVGRRYRLLSPVGRGGMGMVWHAHDVLLDRDVAVKELILPYGLDAAGKRSAHRRMLREARSAARLSHPGIITVHDVVEEDDRPWIVMELVRAWSLEQAVRHTGPLPVVQAAEIGVRVLDALRHAHAAGILHRDVKPGNVMLTSDRVILTDFGIAAVEGDVNITQTGLLMGSPAYIPPERLQGGTITHAADLWSFGATLYAAIEGRPPYEGPDAVAVLGAVLTQEPTRPQRAGALLPVIDGLLRKNPADRISATQVAEMLELVLRSHGSSVPDLSQPPPSAAASPDSLPLHLLPPLDPPPGPMRIIETPSGPVRVPAEPADPGPGSAGGSDAPGLQEGPGGAREASAASGAEAPQSPGDPFGSPADLQNPGFDALRSPSDEDRAPQPSPSSDQDDGAADQPPPRSGGGRRAAGPSLFGPRGSRTNRAGRAGRAGRTGRTGRAPRAGRRRAPDDSTTTGGGSGRGGRRRAQDTSGTWMRGNQPTPRLIAVVTAAAVALLAIIILITLSGGGDDPAHAAPTPSSAVVTTAPKEPAPTGGQVPDGYKRRTQGGFSAAVPTAWRTAQHDDGYRFSGPRDSHLSITVRPATPATDGGHKTLFRSGASTDLADYIQIQLQAVSYGSWKATDWEYTYTQSNGVPMQALTRFVNVDQDTAYTITFAMPAHTWDDNAKLRATFLDTFAP
ncbi:Serine/threonine protein kinase [Sinosporangium album]|uniref:non-specific serine/threonine protein kinase n=1 Tax=Sinosporangium album TaxID=504805 RepID=A0A1G8BQL5_9ACTN|nr:serine/threonine-protein kinase [Sinosporangium album]SDH35485.1 Serine/threonine protein kinase [Sinosporangium album]